MSIRTVSPYALLTLLAFPSCLTVEDDPTRNNADAGAQADDSDEESTDERSTSSEETSGSGDDSTSEDGSTAPDAGASDDSTSADDSTGETPDETRDDAGTGQPEPNPEPQLDTTSFFLPTVDPDNTVAPRIQVDAKGGVHALYATYAGGGAYYAYCAENCTESDAFDVVYLPTDGTVSNAMMTLTEAGQPRLLLSGFLEATYATCDEDCTNEDNWKAGVILEHGGEQEISGQAFAVDADGKPHFLVHTYRAYFNIGQKEPLTYHATCESGDCTAPQDWSTSQIADQIWEEGQLRFDAEGRAHLAFVAVVMEELVTQGHISAYATCTSGCTTSEDWPAVGLANTYLDDTEAISLSASISMDLTTAGKPRLVTLAKSDEGTKQLIYFECDEDCTGEGFQGSILSDHPDVNVGLSLALDADDHPRFVHTLDYNIVLAYCDDLPCSDPEAPWKLEMVESASTIPPDDIILWPNCSVAAWFLHTPALALDAAGNPIVGYQARDISGGVHNADPTKPDCVAGTDMTLTRLTQMVWE